MDPLHTERAPAAGARAGPIGGASGKPELLSRARSDARREPDPVLDAAGDPGAVLPASTSAWQRIGREHLPRTGPLLLASNHRSFLDPFVIGTLVRRPVYYMAKRELFEKRWQAWLLNALGAFPVDRGAGDRDAMEYRPRDPRAG